MHSSGCFLPLQTLYISKSNARYKRYVSERTTAVVAVALKRKITFSLWWMPYVTNTTVISLSHPHRALISAISLSFLCSYI